MSEYITHSRAETVALGARMAAVLAPGSLIAFHRRAGRGQDRLTEALPRLAAPTVSSQPLSIVNYYRGPKAAGAL